MKQLFLVVLLAIIFGVMPAMAAGEKAPDSCKVCTKCSTMCTNTLNNFLKKGGKYADPKRIALMKDCIAICKTNDGFRHRKSTFLGDTDKVCAEVCAKCADSCEELKDPSLKGCIEMCRKCADNCKTGT